jgi:hypothetical protein
MHNRVRMIAAAVAAALLLAGGAIAAVTATGRSTHHHARPGLRAHTRAGGRDLAIASSYLGVPLSQLQRELRAGRSLAQIAQATPGRSVAGLVSALVTAKRQRLAKAAAALPRHVQAEVARSGGPGGGRYALRNGKLRGLLGGAARVGLAVASYVDSTPQQLRSELQAGRTLAQIAKAHNRTEAGLIAVVAKAKREALESAALAGAISRQREAALLANLEKRVRKLVNRPLGVTHPG